MTNVMGAENVISAAISCGVSKIVALSTDKAVNPLTYTVRQNCVLINFLLQGIVLLVASKLVSL